MLKVLLSSFLLFSFNSYAQMSFCTDELETMPVQAGGRDKPLFVLATESLRFISGETKVNELTATQAFCKLSLKAFGMPVEIPLKVKVDHVEVRKFLNLGENEASAPVESLLAKTGDIETELAQLKENNSYKKELNKVNQRLGTYRAIVEARAWSVPLEKNGKLEFVTLAEFLSQERVAAAQGNGENPVKLLFNQARESYLRARGDGYLLELKYFKWNIFQWAILVSLLAIALLVAMKRMAFGVTLSLITIAMQIMAMAMRVMISGRAPVTNMYETVMFSGLGALVLSCIITLLRKERAFMIAGLSFNVMGLMMMKFAHGMLDEGISPLVPVLRDNFWLSTHVTTVILSYAALALSWLLANSLLLRSSFGKISSEEYRYQVDLIYTCIKFGVVLLAAGVILGGVWADYSWGRFWGWDPKETWSLIVLLVYMAILHGKYSTWIPPKRFAPLVAGAFMSVMMAWFGVNYILASGLHSYGFSEGGAMFLGSFFGIQILILVVTQIRQRVA
jgi:cytochrome c-type biogenesis protein CcsB